MSIPALTSPLPTTGIWVWLAGMVLGLGVASWLVQTHPRMSQRTQLRHQVLSWWRLIPFMAAGVVGWPAGLAALAVLILVLALRELAALDEGSAAGVRGGFAPWAAVAAIVVLTGLVWGQLTQAAVFLPYVAALLLVMLALVAWWCQRQACRGRRLLWLGWLGLWPSMACLLAWQARGDHDAQAWAFYLLALTALNDVAQFISGSMWGRHRLAPGLSPNKTWQGVIGGVAVSVALSAALGTTLGLASVPQLCLLGAVLCLAGVWGDLFYSLIKRRLGIKDFSSLIPGHGGLLDRVDSLTVTAPVLAVWLACFNPAS